MKRLGAVLVGAVAAFAVLGLSAVSASAYVPATWSSYGSATFQGNLTITVGGTSSYVCPPMSFAGATSQVVDGARFAGSDGAGFRTCLRAGGGGLAYVYSLRLDMIGQKDGAAFSADAGLGGTVAASGEPMWSSTTNPPMPSFRFRSDWVNGSPATLTLDNEHFGTLSNGKELRVSGTVRPASPSTLALL